DLAELRYRAAVVIFGEHALAALIIQANARTGKHVQTKTDGALGVAGLEVEHEALAPGLVVLARAFTVITVEIQVTQTQGSLGVVDEAETVIRGLGHGQSWQSQHSGGDAAGDQCFSHYVVPRVLHLRGCPSGGHFYNRCNIDESANKSSN